MSIFDTSTEDMPGMRQLVDWSAAIWAGLIGGLVFMIINVGAIPRFETGNTLAIDGVSSWVIVRYIASVVLGEGVLAPATPNVGILLVAILVNFALSVVYALVLAIVIHRWGMIVGIVLGALFGFALYLINMSAFTVLYPWFEAIYSPWFIAAHVAFGAVAGGIYELLEEEEFVPVEEATVAN